MYTVVSARDTCSNNMGAIDPTVAKNQAKFKSASIESANNQPSSRSTRNQYDFDQISLMESDQEEEYHRDKPRQNSFHVKARKFLTLSPASSGLKPSVSTSCLFTAAEEHINNNNTNDTSNAPVIIPTRASLTHEWKKLKTPNKCRECNLLVYFNGRECSFCGFVAHKKCVTVLVIKCSGQQIGLSPAVIGGKNRKAQGVEPLISSHQQLLALNLTPTQQQQQQQQLLSLQQQQVSTRKVKQVPIQPIFGQPVSTDGRQVVDFVRRFIYEIDMRGLTSKGIYRVSSIKSKVDRLCNYYDQNLSSLVDLSSFHPNIIANALKMYLRQLPEPLLTQELYNNFIDVGKKYSSTQSMASQSNSNNNNNNSKERLQGAPILDGWPTLNSGKQRKIYPITSSLASKTATTTSTTTTAVPTKANIVINNPAYDPLLIVELKEIIELLPPVNRELIAIIMRHLRRVADMSGENQMSAKNLSIIFGPTLLSADNNKSLAIVDNIHQARVIELMITWAEQIFPQYANYESKAAIDLDLPEYENEYWQYRSFDERPDMRGGISERTAGDKQQEYSNENSNQSERSSSRNGHRTINDIKTNTNEPLSTKSRNNLRELRRQFFTVPTTKPLAPQAEASDDPKAAANHVEPRKAKLINPPGSVPVIKVLPNYCDKLTTCNNTENKPYT